MPLTKIPMRSCLKRTDVHVGIGDDAIRLASAPVGARVPGWTGITRVTATNGVGKRRARELQGGCVTRFFLKKE